MEISTFQWLAGIGISLLTVAFGMITKALYRLADEMRAENRTAHSRINEVRKEYVRREDLDKHLQSIEKKLDAMTADQKQMTTAVLAALAVREGGQQ